MYVEALPRLPQTLPDYAAAPPVGDRAAWETLPADVRDRLLRRGEAARDEPWPELLASHYLDYTLTGNRTRFEARYFGRRRKLSALAMAECAEAQGRFLPAIVDGALLLCEESGWQLPAHNAYERGGPRRPLPDTAAPVIDLFAAETGAQLAVLAQALAAPLDAVDPGIVRRIDRELEQRIFRPYLERHFWWMGNGDEPMNNWTAWCTQNVLLAAFTRPIGQPLRRAVVTRAAAGLDAFLKDYGDDGACEEGPLYYRHAGLCLWGATQILAAVAPGAFAPLWRAPKIGNVAEYIARVHVAGPRYFNFADCSAVIERCSAREYRFGKAVGSPLLTAFAAADAAAGEAPDLPDEINLWYRVLAAQTAAEMRAGASALPPQADHYYPSIGLMIARDSRWALAVKAGDNGDSHNHNDVGSFTLYRDGRPVLIDLGVESYTARTFSPRRYEIWTMQSAWHNLPSFGGVMQRDGAAFAARDVDVSLGDSEARMTLEIAGAYPPEARLRSYRRSVRLVKGHGVEIDDRHDGDLPPELSLLFAERPELVDGAIRLPGLAEIVVAGAGTMRAEEVPVTDERLRQAWPGSIWRVLVPHGGPALSLRIGCGSGRWS